MEKHYKPDYLVEEFRKTYFTIEPRGSGAELRSWELVSFGEESDQEAAFERLLTGDFEEVIQYLGRIMPLRATDTEDEIRQAWEEAEDAGGKVYIEERGAEIYVDIVE